jgi:hypothetical protein
MREVRVICGTTYIDNRYATHDVDLTAFTRFEDAVVRATGGYTMTFGVGAWKDDKGHVVKEQVRIYDIGLVATPQYETLVIDAAEELCHRANQQCVYFRDHRGVVDFIS